MKQNLSLTAYFIVYLGLAIFCHPARNLTTSLSTPFYSNQQQAEVKNINVASEPTTEVLHGELLFDGAF